MLPSFHHKSNKSHMTHIQKAKSSLVPEAHLTHLKAHLNV